VGILKLGLYKGALSLLLDQPVPAQTLMELDVYHRGIVSDTATDIQDNVKGKQRAFQSEKSPSISKDDIETLAQTSRTSPTGERRVDPVPLIPR